MVFSWLWMKPTQLRCICSTAPLSDTDICAITNSLREEHYTVGFHLCGNELKQILLIGSGLVINWKQLKKLLPLCFRTLISPSRAWIKEENWRSRQSKLQSGRFREFSLVQCSAGVQQLLNKTLGNSISLYSQLASLSAGSQSVVLGITQTKRTLPLWRCSLLLSLSLFSS